MEIKEFSKKMINAANKINIVLNQNQINQFYDYMNLLIDWNEKINLTAITEPDDVIVKHFIDSLTIAEDIVENSRLIDIGTGAGFPGIPLKIYNSSLNITLLDSLNKRTIFLNEVIKKLSLKNVEVIHGRAEDFAQNLKYRECFDYAVSRAVAPLNILLEYLVPYIKVGGKVIAMKGSNAEEEIKFSKNALQKLETSISKNKKIELPNNSGERYILIMKKNKKTNKIYPRKAGTPKKNPL